MNESSAQLCIKNLPDRVALTIIEHKWIVSISVFNVGNFALLLLQAVNATTSNTAKINFIFFIFINFSIVLFTSIS